MVITFVMTMTIVVQGDRVVDDINGFEDVGDVGDVDDNSDEGDGIDGDSDDVGDVDGDHRK